MMETTQNIAKQRCHHHDDREAAAICLSCQRYFCRECITEHDDRMVCTECLFANNQGIRSVPRTIAMFKMINRTAQFTVCMFILWLLFYYIGIGLISLPDPFHEGTIWQVDF